jgi:hypothetical protein
MAELREHQLQAASDLSEIRQPSGNPLSAATCSRVGGPELHLVLHLHSIRRWPQLVLAARLALCKSAVGGECNRHYQDPMANWMYARRRLGAVSCDGGVDEEQQ